jgi:hypothetical protein
MAIKDLEEYQKTYSDFVEHLVGLHNYHQRFMVNFSTHMGYLERHHLRKMLLLGRKLQKLSRQVVKQAIVHKKQESQRLKEEKLLQKKLNPRKTGRPRLNRIKEKVSVGRPKRIIKEK